MSNNNEKYSLHCNNCLRGQVDKEEDYRSRGWEFKSSHEYQQRKKDKGKSEVSGVGGRLVKREVRG